MGTCCATQERCFVQRELDDQSSSPRGDATDSSKGAQRTTSDRFLELKDSSERGSNEQLSSLLAIASVHSKGVWTTSRLRR